MKKEILSEVNRFREIMGLNLLSEGKIPTALIDDLVSAFAKKNVDELMDAVVSKEATALRKVFDDVSDATGKDLQSIIRGFKAGNLEGKVEDMFVAKLIQSGTDSLKQAAIKSYVTGNPKVVIDTLQSIENAASLSKSLSPEKYSEYVANAQSIINSSALSTDMKKYLMSEFNTVATSAGLSGAESAARASANIAKNYLDEAGNLSSDLSKTLDGMAKQIGETPEKLKLYAKDFIKANPNINLSELEQKLVETQSKVKEAYTKLSGEKQKAFKQKYDNIKSYLKIPGVENLSRPLKILSMLAVLGILWGAYELFENFQVDIDEARELAKKIMDMCKMDQQTAERKITVTGSDIGRDKYYTYVYVNNTRYPVTDNDGILTIPMRSLLAETTELSCDMLQDFPADKKSGVLPSSSQGTTNYNATDNEKLEVLKKLSGQVPNLGGLKEEGDYIKKTGDKTFTYTDVNNKVFDITLP